MHEKKAVWYKYNNIAFRRLSKKEEEIEQHGNSSSKALDTAFLQPKQY